MSELPMRAHFRYLRFKKFPMTPKTPQCKVFWALLSSSEHSGVSEDSKPSTFPSVGLHPHTWPKWGCDIRLEAKEMVSTITIVTKQHLISIICPLTYLTWIIKWRNPSRRDDGRIQVRQVVGRTIFGIITNCASVSSL